MFTLAMLYILSTYNISVAEMANIIVSSFLLKLSFFIYILFFDF
ncbi:hypothetical protein AC27_2005 [Escherichia coli 1-182-04_S3_C2]|nr:hypothetical protein AC56_2315 [Escherichia coli 1-182-04_S3_C3]EZJ85153.1 hypothetical protein AC27_2005 [Escherichia coli 1-182-04_S3_C2]EZJ96992.1 hypothetical protein AB99_2303 [Escherichia coli 1-182-04_S3_C1]